MKYFLLLLCGFGLCGCKSELIREPKGHSSRMKQNKEIQKFIDETPPSNGMARLLRDPKQPRPDEIPKHTVNMKGESLPSYNVPSGQ